ncbi:thiamine pyrophosphate-dependent enzyme [Haloglomus litoreum]|uniref:thiamine pyrophosphate-dependent enzyme n=1 Tax=Haloglomus litoreum TaxID=3034026 RepID=UPI0023E7BF13|nr:thiamine pyrophosphate-dependent enzyme [Haloglomus sp. DT116]
MHRVIDERPLGDTGLEAADVRALLRDVIRARVFDDRALSLQRRGWMSGYPPYRGQEGSQVAAAHAMRETDWLFPTYRTNAMALARGVPMSDVLLFRRGYPEFVSDHDVRLFPQAVPIATQLPHAVGFGMAVNYRNAVEPEPSAATDGEPARRDGAVAAGLVDPTDGPTDEAVVAYLGDGATSEGDAHEAMNFAGVFEAPVLFLCENNGWAISTPRERQTAADSIAARAEAYGFTGRQVDGTDPLAVLEVVREALATVREGEPMLVESLVHRHGPHTTSDDPSRYEDRVEVPEWRRRDPLDRLTEFAREEGIVDEAFVESAHDRAAREADEAVATAEATAPPAVADLFDHSYADLPPRVREQRAWLHERADEIEPGGPVWE